MWFRRGRQPSEAMPFIRTLSALMLDGRASGRNALEIVAEAGNVLLVWEDARAIAKCRDAPVTIQFDELGRISRMQAELDGARYKY